MLICGVPLRVQERAQPKPGPSRGGLGLGFFPYASARPMMGGLASYPSGLADRASAFGRHDSFSYQPVSARRTALQGDRGSRTSDLEAQRDQLPCNFIFRS